MAPNPNKGGLKMQFRDDDDYFGLPDGGEEIAEDIDNWIWEGW